MVVKLVLNQESGLSVLSINQAPLLTTLLLSTLNALKIDTLDNPVAKISDVP